MTTATEPKVKVEGMSRLIPASRLGVVTLGVSSAEGALEKSGLNWEVVKSESPVSVPIMTKNGLESVTHEGRFITYRTSDSGFSTALGVVGDSYNVIQNAEAFSFLDNLVDESGAEFASAGQLKGGASVFVNMKMPNTLHFANGTDSVNMYLMVTTSHDGSKAFTACVTPMRLICTNQIRIATRAAISKFSLRHTRNSTGKINEARVALGLVHEYEIAFQNSVNELINQEMKMDEFKKFVDVLVPDRFKGDTTTITNSVERTKSELMGLWNSPTQTVVGNTKWAAYNAVAEWADWFKPVRGNRGEEIERAERIVSGATDGLKDKAYALLTR